MVILEAIFWFITAFLLALIEIEIEGKYGWAEKTNTWYKKKGLSKIFKIMYNNRPLTGYHLFMYNLFLLIFFHLAFFVGMSWNINAELHIISVFVVWVTVEDFLWFLFNPNYTLKNYKKNKIWWFSKSHWVFGLFPLDYLFSVAASLFIALIAGSFIYQLEMIGLFLLFTLIFVFLAPSYHIFYKKMRKNDDRKISGIFH